MILPLQRDIGRKVLYRPPSGPPEEGIITSITPDWIFVRYGSDVGSKATSRYDLEWITNG